MQNNNHNFAHVNYFSLNYVGLLWSANIYQFLVVLATVVLSFFVVIVNIIKAVLGGTLYIPETMFSSIAKDYFWLENPKRINSIIRKLRRPLFLFEQINNSNAIINRFKMNGLIYIMMFYLQSTLCFSSFAPLAIKIFWYSLNIQAIRTYTSFKYVMFLKFMFTSILQSISVLLCANAFVSVDELLDYAVNSIVEHVVILQLIRALKSTKKCCLKNIVQILLRTSSLKGEIFVEMKKCTSQLQILFK